MFEARLVAFEVNMSENGTVSTVLSAVDPKQLKEMFNKSLPDYEGTEMLTDIVEFVASRLKLLERDVAKRYGA